MTRKFQSKGSDRSELPPRIERVISKYRKLLPEVERMASFPLLNPNPVFEINFSGKITFSNRACATVLKKLNAGKNVRAFLPPDLKIILKMAGRGKKLQFSRRVCVKEAVFGESIHIVPEYNAIRFYLRDITYREKVERSLRESEERYKGLFQGLSLSTVVFQREGKDFVVREFNRASNALTSGKMPKYVGRSARELYRSRPDILKKFDGVWKKKNTQILQSSYRMLSTGRLIYLNLTLTFIPPDKILVHTEDLTEKKQAEDLLHHQAKILEAVNDAVIVTDPFFRITDWNKAAERIYGWKTREVIGKSISSVLRSEMTDKERAAMYKRLHQGKPAFTELVQLTRDKRRLVISGYTIPLRDAQRTITDFVAINRDITVQKRYEKALKDTKENLEFRVRQRTAELERARSAVEAERRRLYDVMETLPVYVVLLDKDYHVPFANRFFRKRFGESGGRRCYEYLFHRKSPCPVCESYKVMKTGLPHRWEWTGPDGHTYDISDFPFRDADGSSLIMEMGIDITEQKRAQEALIRVNEYHRMLIEVNLDPVVTISAEGKITDVNEATTKATGVLREKLIGTDFSNYFTDPQKAREGYKQVFTRGFVADYPLTIRHRNGGLKDVLYNASVYKDEKDNVLGVFAAARDITVLKRAEEELKKHRDHLEELVKEGTRDLLKSQERLQRAEEIAHLGGWELDLADNRLLWSDEVYRIFGLKPKEFGATYKAFLEHVHPDDRAAVDKAYSSSLSDGRNYYEIEHRVVRKDNGEIRWVHERCEHQRDDDGRVIRSVGMVQDITYRKRAETEMRALNLRLEEINRHLNDFVFTVSHDLKAPLRAIQGYANALLEDQAQRLDPDGRINIERIVIAGQRLDDMIQDLLAYSRISSVQITTEPVDLETLVKKVIERLPPEAAVKNAAFSVDPGLPVVIAHRPFIEQILDNLVLNAVTYVNPGVRPEIRIWAEDQRGWTYLFIKDNGIGIAAGDQERIFKVFERLHGVESYPGTGVGLAIVKKGIERMGGRFGVISKPGEGSTFWIALPREIDAKI